ncbi:glycine-rich RNA-binding protein 7-like [Mus caroli]|uniref:Glycine-rich RNA-binding protein 7-like n=1 Tax=Mus caroli TaxID=10089 RepID=A0A6P7R6J7_MUSCR|nr:glycine-rich RNA-binding protein 7-like [Mus caroli]
MRKCGRWGGEGSVEAVEAGAPSGLGSRRSGRVGGGGDSGDGGSRRQSGGMSTGRGGGHMKRPLLQIPSWKNWIQCLNVPYGGAGCRI